MRTPSSLIFFFFNDTATTEIYTLSLHDALPIYRQQRLSIGGGGQVADDEGCRIDRKSTRLNSSHDQISYAVFCLKKKKGRSVMLRREVVLAWIVVLAGFFGVWSLMAATLPVPAYFLPPPTAVVEAF